jgi:hypothetical protein
VQRRPAQLQTVGHLNDFAQMPAYPPVADIRYDSQGHLG